MSSRQKHISSAIALFLIFATAQVYVGVSLATPLHVSVPAANSAALPQEPAGILQVPDGKAITVNGASAITGATIVNGAIVETPDGVAATVAFGSPGSLEIQPHAKLTLDVHDGSIKVMLAKGCVILRTKKGTAGEIDTPDGVLGKNDPAKDGVLKVCTKDAVAAVATAPAVAVAAAAAAGVGGGLGTVAAVAVIGGLTAASFIVPAVRGTNPSTVTP